MFTLWHGIYQYNTNALDTHRLQSVHDIPTVVDVFLGPDSRHLAAVHSRRRQQLEVESTVSFHLGATQVRGTTGKLLFVIMIRAN